MEEEDDGGVALLECAALGYCTKVLLFAIGMVSIRLERLERIELLGRRVLRRGQHGRAAARMMEFILFLRLLFVVNILPSYVSGICVRQIIVIPRSFMRHMRYGRSLPWPKHQGQVKQPRL
mmetsp:Transcript_383/g.756  ORF Transcript_383/g.756 Transcript_383/m.756 type:complete len:121 (-) Transcript_383:44-406(-)